MERQSVLRMQAARIGGGCNQLKIELMAEIGTTLLNLGTEIEF
jgi:hypothetical protein